MPITTNTLPLNSSHGCASCAEARRNTNRSWRVDETYCRVAGKWTYLYRAVDSAGDTIDSLLSAKRDAVAAKHFLQKTLRSPGHPRPRVINVDRNPPYPKAISETERNRPCRPPLSLSTGTVLEQRRRTRPSSHPAPASSMSGLPVLPGGPANDSGDRNDEHASKGTGEVDRKRRNRRASHVRRRHPRSRHPLTTTAD